MTYEDELGIFRREMHIQIEDFISRIRGEIQKYPEDFADATVSDLHYWFVEES